MLRPAARKENFEAGTEGSAIGPIARSPRAAALPVGRPRESAPKCAHQSAGQGRNNTLVRTAQKGEPAMVGWTPSAVTYQLGYCNGAANVREIDFRERCLPYIRRVAFGGGSMIRRPRNARLVGYVLLIGLTGADASKGPTPPLETRYRRRRVNSGSVPWTGGDRSRITRSGGRGRRVQRAGALLVATGLGGSLSSDTRIRHHPRVVPDGERRIARGRLGTPGPRPRGE